MKKIPPFLLFTFLLTISCLLITQQAESTPRVNPSTATPQEIPHTQEPPVPVIPQHWLTSTPRPIPLTSTPIIPTPHWTLPTLVPTDRSIFADGLAPEYRAILNALPYASLYSIDFVISNDLYHVTGHETVTYTNAEDVELKEINLRLFPNILGGEMRVENVTINEESVKTVYSLDDSLLTLRLRHFLEPQKSTTISMDFIITVAQTIGAHYSVQTYYDKILTLAHAYPMIVVYDDEGWNAEIPSQHGDITYSDISFYIVTVEAPAQVTLVGSGREVNREESGGRQRVTYVTGPARDFYLAASSEYSVVIKETDEVTLKFYARKSQEDGAKYALDIAAKALDTFSARYAPYPYRELGFVTTPTDAGGVEYPGMIAIAKQYITTNSAFLEGLVTHEVAHQWFYNLVGNDQLDDPWIDESLTQFATLQYFTDIHGPTGNDLFRQGLEKRWASVAYKEIPVGLPVSDYTNDEYSAIVYGRGALFFKALSDIMGVETFDVFMQDYTQSNAWNIATPEKLKKKAEEHCACDLTPLFQKWIYP